MDLDIFEVIRASIYVPLATKLFSPRGVSIKGHFYTDSTPASRFHIHVKKAIAEGAQRVVVFDNWHDGDNPKGYFFSKIFTHLKNKNFQEKQLGYFKEIENFTSPLGIDFILFKPKTKLNMSRWNDNKDNARAVFNRGYQETINNVELKKLYE